MFNWLRTEKRLSDNEIIADIAEGIAPGTRPEVVTRQQALSIPAVAKAVDWISSTIAGLPIKMYRKTDSGYVEVYDDYRLKLVNEFSGNCMTANDLKRSVLTDLLLDGNGYAYVVKRGNTIEKLSYIPTSRLTYTESVDSINKTVRTWVDAAEVPEYNLLRLVKNSKNGLSGVGFISDNQDLLNTIISSLAYERNTLSTGVQRGFLKSKTKLDEPRMKELRRAWRRLTQPNQSDVLVLNAGIEFEAASNTAAESQLSQNKVANINQILTYFGLPTNFLTGTNSDAYLTAVRIAILPLVKQLTTAFNEYLLLESEKDSIRFIVDTTELIRVNINERMQAYSTGLSSGVLTIDEVRRMENLPVMDLPYIKMGLGDVLYNTSNGEIFVPNTGSIVKPGENNSLQDDEPVVQ